MVERYGGKVLQWLSIHIQCLPQGYCAHMYHGNQQKTRSKAETSKAETSCSTCVIGQAPADLLVCRHTYVALNMDVEVAYNKVWLHNHSQQEWQHFKPNCNPTCNP